MDWRAAVRYTLIAGVIVVGIALAVLLVDAIWAQLGIIAAVVVLAGAMYALKKWDDRRAARDRERFEHSR